MQLSRIAADHLVSVATEPGSLAGSPDIFAAAASHAEMDMRYTTDAELHINEAMQG